MVVGTLGVTVFASIHRGVGCIFFEMACGRPMFPGSSVEEELLLIWKVNWNDVMHSVEYGASMGMMM